MAEYRLAPKAREDMEAVWLYSLKLWGVQQAERYIDDLTEAFGFLVESPKAGTACDNIPLNIDNILLFAILVFPVKQLTVCWSYVYYMIVC